MPKVLIIGAGLSGLTSAFALKDSEYEGEILEARPRLGGRIFTKEVNSCQLELGATWFGPQHTSLMALINQLEIPFKTQENGSEAIYDFRPKGNLERFQIPNQRSSTFKFKSGSSSLINTLFQKQTGKVHFNEIVKSISYSDTFTVETEQNQFEADYLILTIPLQLIADTIEFEPGLPQSFQNLLSNTHTWMSDSIKFSVAFNSDFWKNDRYIGTLMSPQQIVQEMYDHSDKDREQNALVGFLNAGYSELSEENRKERLSNQLRDTFNQKAFDIKAYADVNWRNEAFTIHKQAKALIPHQNNGNPKLREGLFENCLYFSASETAGQTPGYMDGAVHRGMEVAELLLKKLG